MKLSAACVILLVRDAFGLCISEHVRRSSSCVIGIAIAINTFVERSKGNEIERRGGWLMTVSYAIEGRCLVVVQNIPAAVIVVVNGVGQVVMAAGPFWRSRLGLSQESHPFSGRRKGTIFRNSQAIITLDVSKAFGARSGFDGHHA